MRFPGFGGGWCYNSLGECADSLEYGMNAAAVMFDGIHKYIRITDIDEETGEFLANPITSPDGILEEKYKVKENDILFARTGASVGKSYLYNIKDGELYFAGFLIRARIKSKYNGAFIYYQTKRQKYNKWVKLTSMRSGQPGINSQEYARYRISLADRDEQDKIAKFLCAIYKKIYIQNKIISKYETLIKGLCNCLLAELEQYPKIPLSNILVEYNEKTTADNEYPILSSTMNGIFIQTEYFNKQAASEKTIGYKKIPYGYCTYRSMSDTGEFHFNLQKVVEIGIVSPAYPVFTSDSYNIDFVAFYLNNSNCLKKQIIGAKAGGTRFALSYSKLLKLFIPDIDKKRQERVVMIYDSLLYKLDVELLYLKKIKEQKQYLLSQMFI